MFDCTCNTQNSLLLNRHNGDDALQNGSCDQLEKVYVLIQVTGAVGYIYFMHPIDIASHLVPTRRVTGVYNVQGRALSRQGL